jgi:hypothetical protein
MKPREWGETGEQVECIVRQGAHRVRGEGEHRHPIDAGTEQSVRGLCRHPTRNPYDRHTLAEVIPAMEALIGNGPRRCRLSWPHRAARLQVQDLHLLPGAARDSQDQAADLTPCRDRAPHRPSRRRAAHGPEHLVHASGDAIDPSLPPPAITSASSSPG